MWGFGGKYFWGRKESGKVEGIVVVFGWMSSQDKHLMNYVDLYSSLGWNSLVCHSPFLNLFFPDKAASLALQIVNELVQELKVRPCPVVFASFSGGPKACMYKVLQIIEGKCEEIKADLEEYRLVRDCVSGHIFDSTPVDFVSEVGARFVLSPTVLKKSSPPPFVSSIVHGISSSLDALFLTRAELQRADYWQTLYATISMGAPYLILCSENDELAPYQVIQNFASRLKDLGADVKLVKWSNSSHVGHLLHYPEVYKESVAELLSKASAIYSQRIRQLEGERMGMEGVAISDDPFSSLRKAAAESSGSFRRISFDLKNDDHFLGNGSLAYDHEDRDERRERYLPTISNWNSNSNTNPREINHVHGVLGQYMFDACVPRNVEDWDLRSSLPSSARRRSSHFNPMKCIRRSRL